MEFHQVTRTGVLLLVMAVAAGEAGAQTEGAPGAAQPLKGTLTAQLVGRDAKTGQETLLPAENVLPRDTVQYTLAYRNAGSEALAKVELVIPVPPGTVYVAKSATPVANAPTTFSVDGGQTYQKPPLVRKERGPRGIRTVPAGPDKVTHVKWTVTRLRPDDKFAASCRVTVR